jgi:hypothetical protein
VSTQGEQRNCNRPKLGTCDCILCRLRDLRWKENKDLHSFKLLPIEDQSSLEDFGAIHLGFEVVLVGSQRTEIDPEIVAVLASQTTNQLGCQQPDLVSSSIPTAIREY